MAWVGPTATPTTTTGNIAWTSRSFRSFFTPPSRRWPPPLNLGSDITRRKFLARLQGEISKRGTTAILRNGIKHGPHRINLFYGAPSPGNDSAKLLYGLNRFTVTRQLRYSNDNAQLPWTCASSSTACPSSPSS